MSGKSFTRTTRELSPVLFEPPQEDRVVYSVKSADPLQDLKIRYDETTIFPGPIGRELPKTFGHYHPKNPNGVYYPEIYTVLDGRAWYIIQRPNEKNPRVIEEIYLVETQRGEKAVIPPGFGHVTINPEDKKLHMANWVGLFEYDYQTYENLRGACYYFLESKSKLTNIEKNSYYEFVPELIKVRPKEILELGITKNIPLREIDQKHLEFLTKPEKYLNLLTIEKCYTKI